MSSKSLLNIDNHHHIYQKLDYFLSIEKIPNIIFHGPSGSGKRNIVEQFLYKIYGNDKEKINSFVSWPIARGSEAAKNSSIPIPIKSGDLLLAIIIF